MRLMRRNLRTTTSALLSLVILVVALINYQWLGDAFALVYRADMNWISAAALTILASYFATSMVLNMALRSMGYQLGTLRIWAMTIVAVVLSQSVPAGGVGSYAFLVGSFKRRGVPSGQATLAASLEVLSYVSTMLLIFLFALIYMTISGQGTSLASYVAAAVALVLVSSAVFVLTRREERLMFGLLAIQRKVEETVGFSWRTSWMLGKVIELSNGRALLASRSSDMALLVVLQMIGLGGHTLAMLMVIWSLGYETSFFVVLTAFGIGLITSTFNVLPGGGGTVEAALVAVLIQSGLGAAAVPAAIIFRLLNFWLVMPIAAACYYWLMHEHPVEAGKENTNSVIAEQVRERLFRRRYGYYKRQYKHSPDKVK